MPITARISKAFGPVSRHFTAQILLQMCHVSRVYRAGQVVVTLCVLRNNMCTAQRSHMDGEEQRCRTGCLVELYSLSQQ